MNKKLLLALRFSVAPWKMYKKYFLPFSSAELSYPSEFQYKRTIFSWATISQSDVKKIVMCLEFLYHLISIMFCSQMGNTSIPVPASRPDGIASSGTTIATSTVSFSLASTTILRNSWLIMNCFFTGSNSYCPESCVRWWNWQNGDFF